MTNGRKTTYKERVEIVSFCIANANDYNLTANKYKVSYQQVYSWVKKYDKNGYDALVDRRGKHKALEELSESDKTSSQLKLLEAENINEKWLTDVTEFKLTNGTKAYLSAILDLKDNSIISYVLGTSNNKLIFDTLDKATIANPTASPLFHSDRGFQYTSKSFKNKLNDINATQSMSRVGRCIDNGPMEGFWGTLKSEMYYLRKFDRYKDLEQAIDEYIEFYNTKRLQKN